MRKSNIVLSLLAVLGMAVLILDGSTALEGVRSGIEICLYTLIPSLFPFFILSGLITSSLTGQVIRWLHPIGKLCRIPAGSESLFLLGILGGYPVGAGNVWHARENGAITHQDARRMAVFCNNPGPSFLFGVLGTCFPDGRWTFLLWLVQIVSAILTGMLLPGGNVKATTSIKQTQIHLSDLLNRTVKNMAGICGWVVLFRMVLEFLNKWILWILPVSVQVVLTGLLELSNGCLELSQIDSVTMRFFLASVMLSSGGICILMQTHAVFPSLELNYYLSGKMLQCGFGILLTCALLLFHSNHTICALILLMTALSIPYSNAHRLRKPKKEVAIF